MFWRIIFPVAMVAFFFAPWFNASQDVTSMETTTKGKVSAYQILKPTLDCFRNGELSVTGECKPQGGGINIVKSYLLLAAAGLAIAAVVFHIVGFASIIRRFASVIGLLAGLSALGAAGWSGFDMIGSLNQIADQWNNVGWGTYGTGAAALITTIASFFGMRSEEA